MSFSEATYVAPINWRMANHSVNRPNLTIEFSRDELAKPRSDLQVFLPHDPRLEVCAVRDWLHDETNNEHGYRLHGEYSHNRGKYQCRTTFKGFIVEFFCPNDAAMFKLTWG